MKKLILPLLFIGTLVLGTQPTKDSIVHRDYQYITKFRSIETPAGQRRQMYFDSVCVDSTVITMDSLGNIIKIK